MAGLVKHYQNTMKGIPQLTNNWGAMINLLDAVLVNGFNHVTILGLTKANTASITATINLGSDHGFIDRQVVRIAGSTNGWNGDYKVLSADTSSIIIECTAEHSSVISGTATCFTAPADFEIAYQTPVGSIEPKRAYRSTDPESLGLILLVHDFCVSGASATGAKFAKVGVVQNMTDIDTIVGNQMPFNPLNPNANWGWDGTNHGWAKWYYANPAYSQSYFTVNDAQSPNEGNRGFNIVGDASSIVLNIAENMCSALFGFLEFFDPSFQGKNACLLANGINTTPIPQSQAGYGGCRQGYGQTLNGPNYFSDSSFNQRGQLWFDTQGLYNPTTLGRFYFPAFQGNTSWGQFSGAVSSNQYIFLQEFIVDNLNNFRGVLPFLRKTTKKGNEVVVSEEGKTIARYYDDRGAYWFGLCLEAR
ncbi:hypothetical protein [Acinetobacter lwoffii]|uniref:hypothetical protein n=1 Tax=Acinetobacter lwoffii TaxID=28090 RepID=UPI003F8D55BE